MTGAMGRALWSDLCDSDVEDEDIPFFVVPSSDWWGGGAGFREVAGHDSIIQV